jgi:hypothetical protein
MNSVAGVLKLYFRELKDPLFPRDSFDAFANCMRTRIYNETLKVIIGNLFCFLFSFKRLNAIQLNNKRFKK